MTQRDRKGWIVMGWIVLALFFASGPVRMTVGVFFQPLIREFGLNHAQVARTASILVLTGGLFSPVAGWLLDYVRAPALMAAGIVITCLGYLFASHAHSMEAILFAYGIIGVGVSASSFVPATVVAASWFADRKGLAIGVTHLGSTLGMTLGPLLVAQILIHHSWRTAMLTLAAPMLVIALPIAFFGIKLPEGARAPHRRAEAAGRPGLSFSQAMLTLPFWLIMGVQLCFGIGFGSIYYHAVPYFISIGYGATTAARIWGLQAAFSGTGFIIYGWMADRFGGRSAMVIASAMMVFSIYCMLHIVPHTGMGMVTMLLWMFCWANTGGVSTTVLPVMAVDALGVRPFGQVVGMMYLVNAAAGAIGPVLAGRLFDRFGSYTGAFHVAMLLIACCAIFSALVRPARGHDAVEQEPVLQAAV